MKIRLKKEVVEHFEETATIVCVGEKVYYHLPYWYEKVSDDTYKELSYEKIPCELKNYIKEL